MKNGEKKILSRVSISVAGTPTNHLAIELQHISKKYQILSVFYRYQKRFKYHILAHMPFKSVFERNPLF
jgi:hypothetical protein